MFETPKRHILGRNRMFWRISRQNPSTALGCSELQEPPKKLGAESHACAETKRLADRDVTGVGVHDVITCADLYYDRLRGLGVAGGQILGFSLTIDRFINDCSLVRCDDLFPSQKVDTYVNFCLNQRSRIVSYIYLFPQAMTLNVLQLLIRV